jgi:hypothetical protein
MQSPLRPMAPLSLRRTAGVLRLDGLLLAALLLPAALGLLAPLEQSLRAVMAARPLTPLWFPLFMLLGTLLPLVVRLAQRREPRVRQVLDPYLLLLAGQIVSELAVVLAGGRGLGVLVGMTFTVVRLAQLLRLRPLAAGLPWLHGLLLLELVLWGANALQMLLNRWLPLLAGA